MREKRDGNRVLEFRVGIADSVAKSVAYRLLEPALQVGPEVRLACSEGSFAELLGRLALHRLDLLIADTPLSRQVSVKAFNHALGKSSVSFYAAPSLRDSLVGTFPRCLDGAPMLLPGPSSSLRRSVDAWLARHRLQPRVLGEFEDVALMAAFGREGRGVFVSASVLEAETEAQYGVESIGRSDEVVEEFFAISLERRITHPCVAAITDAARGQLFGG